MGECANFLSRRITFMVKAICCKHNFVWQLLLILIIDDALSVSRQKRKVHILIKTVTKGSNIFCMCMCFCCMGVWCSLFG